MVTIDWIFAYASVLYLQDSTAAPLPNAHSRVVVAGPDEHSLNGNKARVVKYWQPEGAPQETHVLNQDIIFGMHAKWKNVNQQMISE